MDFRRPAIAATFLIGCAVPLVGHTAAFAAGSGRNLCAPPADTVGPSVSKVRFSKPTIDLDSGRRVQKIKVTASDTSGNGDPSGVAHIVALIEGKRFFKDVTLELTSGTPTAGRWVGRFVVSKYAHAGTYSIDDLTVVAAARNQQEYPGYGKDPNGPNDLSLNPADDPTFTVTGTPAQRPPRTAAGSLKAFTLHPSSVDTTAHKRHVRLVAKFAGADPRHVYVSMYSDKRARNARFVYLRATLHNHDGRWTGSVAVPRWAGDQSLPATLFAEYGRRYRPGGRSYDAHRLHRMGFPNAVSIVSGVDRKDPRLKSLTFSPTSIDSTTGAEQVTVTAEATDARSGVDSIDVAGGIRHGVNGVAGGLYPFASAGVGYLSSDDFHVRLKQNADGDWVGTTTVKKCVPSGTYKLSANVRDVAGNYRSYSTKELARAGITSTVDVTSKHGDIVAPYVYSAATYGADSKLFLNFSEGVAEVNTSTLTVFPLSPSRSRYTTPSTITALTCANGTDTVDCSGSDGLVTSAALTISDLEPGKIYQVYANLDQVTPQLVDGNGNPMDWNYAAAEVKDS